MLPTLHVHLHAERFKLTWFPAHSYGVLQNYCGSYCYCEKRKAAKCVAIW